MARSNASPKRGVPVMWMAALVVVGCQSGDLASTSSLWFSGEPVALEEVGCDALLSGEEINDLLAGEFHPLGRRASSCYWSTSQELVQLVVQTGDNVEAWRTQLLSSFTEEIDGQGFEIWKEPGSGSVAAFGPQRGLVVHGAGSEANAIRLLRLALSRL